jgi:hypothetical protein
VPCSLFNAASIPIRDEEDEEDERDDDEPGEHEASDRFFLLLPAPATNADGTSAVRGEATSILQLMSLLNSPSPEQDKEINIETERRYESQEQALEDHSTTCEEQVLLLASFDYECLVRSVAVPPRRTTAIAIVVVGFPTSVVDRRHMAGMLARRFLDQSACVHHIFKTHQSDVAVIDCVRTNGGE